MKITPIIVFVIMIQRIFASSSLATAHCVIFLGNCRFLYFHSLLKSAFLVSKGLLCLYDKRNNTWLLLDMEFLFSCSTRAIELNTRRVIWNLRALMYYSPYNKYSLYRANDASRASSVSRARCQSQLVKPNYLVIPLNDAVPQFL